MSGPHSALLPDATFVTIPAAAGLDADDALDWHIDLDVFEQATSNTNWDTVQARNPALLNGIKNSTGAQNASIDFTVILAAGTWTVELLYLGGSDSGIYSIRFDGVEKGTIDSYGDGENALASVTGIVVTTTARITLRLQMATKNASSASYYGYLQHVQLRRTA